MEPNKFQNVAYYSGFAEPGLFQAPRSQRNRRKSAPGADHIKHRRTRSGCFTCRSRRVKVRHGLEFLPHTSIPNFFPVRRDASRL